MAATRQWTLTIISPADAPLRIERDGARLDLNQVGPGLATPVELLLAAVGSCFALSCHAAFTTRGKPRTGFEVVVTGIKAERLPSRLALIRQTVRFEPSLATEDAHAIATLAKQMCTVTNTLAAVPPCELVLEVVD